MPFCSQCGNQVDAADVFCAKCGARQPYRPAASRPIRSRPSRRAPPPSSATFPALGWIGSIIVLASERFRNNRVVRFHAFQGLYLFVAYLIEDWVLKPMFMVVPHVHINGIIEAVLLGVRSS